MLMDFTTVTAPSWEIAHGDLRILRAARAWPRENADTSQLQQTKRVRPSLHLSAFRSHTNCISYWSAESALNINCSNIWIIIGSQEAAVADISINRAGAQNEPYAQPRLTNCQQLALTLPSPAFEARRSVFTLHGSPNGQE